MKFNYFKKYWDEISKTYGWVNNHKAIKESKVDEIFNFFEPLEEAKFAIVVIGACPLRPQNWANVPDWFRTVTGEEPKHYDNTFIYVNCSEATDEEFDRLLESANELAEKANAKVFFKRYER